MTTEVLQLLTVAANATFLTCYVKVFSHLLKGPALSFSSMTKIGLRMEEFLFPDTRISSVFPSLPLSCTSGHHSTEHRMGTGCCDSSCWACLVYCGLYEHPALYHRKPSLQPEGELIAAQPHSPQPAEQGWGREMAPLGLSQQSALATLIRATEAPPLSILGSKPRCVHRSWGSFTKDKAFNAITRPSLLYHALCIDPWV